MHFIKRDMSSGLRCGDGFFLPILQRDQTKKMKICDLSTFVWKMLSFCGWMEFLLSFFFLRKEKKRN